MVTIMDPAELPYDPIYDDPDHASVPLTALVMRASQTSVLRAEQHFGRSVVFCPRFTDLTRVHGRGRTVARRTHPQWPNYAFVHTLHATPELLRELKSRYYIHHLHTTRHTIIPVSQLQPSRHLERISQARTRDNPIPAPPAVGDLVSVQVGRWSSLQGEVIEIRKSMIVIAVPYSRLPVRADITAVTVVDRKKVLA